MQSSLEKRLKKLFEQLITEAYSQNLNAVAFEIKAAEQEIFSPMRVAIVGDIKVGKSTLMNAILEQEIVPTGIRVLTFNVNWFRYSDERYLKINFKNGTSEIRAFDQLAYFVAECQDNEKYQNSIWWVDVFYPHPLLKEFDLIDTPGLASMLKTDSTKTKELLSSNTNRPHALVYMMRQELKESDIENLEAFHAMYGGLMTGITALGAFSRIDELDGDYIAEANRIIKNNQDRYPKVNRNFYKIIPIAAKLFLASKTISDGDLFLIRQICLAVEEDLDKYIRDPKRLIRKEFSKISKAEISRLIDKVGIQGVRLLLKYVDQTKNPQLEDSKQIFEKKSNCRHLLNLLINHFGNRAVLIKSKLYLERLCETLGIMTSRYFDEAKDCINSILSSIRSFQLKEAGFTLYALLELYYNGKLDFNEQEGEWLLEITGEKGRTIHEKLGLDTGSSKEALLNTASKKIAYWRNVSQDFFSRSLEDQEAARLLAEVYDAVIFEIKNEFK